MIARLLAMLLALTACVTMVAVGCGGIAHRGRELEPVEAGIDGAWDGGDTVRRVHCDARPKPTFDHDVECRLDSDCTGTATCQSNHCCAGTFRDGACRCGDGPGCDLQHACCQSASGTIECVGSLSACATW